MQDKDLDLKNLSNKIDQDGIPKTFSFNVKKRAARPGVELPRQPGQLLAIPRQYRKNVP